MKLGHLLPEQMDRLWPDDSGGQGWPLCRVGGTVSVLSQKGNFDQADIAASLSPMG